VIDGTAVVKVAIAEIASIQRSLDKGSSLHPVFEIELKNGDLIAGRLRAPAIEIREGERLWKIPVAHLIAFRAGGGK